jgi:hypothetical protein
MIQAQKARFGGVFDVWAYDKDGKFLWHDTAKNLVPNPALQLIIDDLFNGGTQYTDWHVGITGDTPAPAAGDNMGGHAGWAEVVAYGEGARQTYTGVRTNQTESNSAAKATFSINVDTTHIGGAFLTTSDVKGGGVGVLLCCAPFTAGNKILSSGDSLVVQYNFAAADDGI